MMPFKRKYFLFLLPLLLLVQAAMAAPSKNVRVGVYENAPKIYTNESGEVLGFWAEIIEYIAAEENWEIEWVHGTWEQGLERLEKGEIDIMPDVAFSEERNKKYAFSNEAMLVSWSRVYVAKNADIQSLLDLEGKKIAVLKDSINYEGVEGVKEILRGFDVNVTFLEMESYPDVFASVASGEADAGVTNKDFGNKNETLFDIDRTPIILMPVHLLFAFPQDASQTAYLIEKIDFYLVALKADNHSFYYRALETWLGRESAKEVIPVWFFWAGGVAALFLGLLLGGNLLLRARVRKKTLDLEVSKEELSLIMDNIPSMIAYVDRAQRYIYVDQSYATWYGFDKEDVVGKLIEEVLPPENYAKVRPNLERMIASEGELHYQHTITRHDGETRTVAVSYIPHLDAQGKMKAFFAALHDISEEMKINAALQESELKYRALVDNALVGIFIIQKGRLKFSNQGLAEIFGYEDPEQMMGILVQETIAPESWTKVKEEMSSKESGEKRISQYHFKAIRRDGSIFDAEILSEVISHEGQPAIQGVLIDITDRVTAEERFRGLSEASFEAIFISEKGICLEENLAAEKLFGYPPEEAIGMSGTEIFVLEDRDKVIANMLSGYEKPYRATALRKDGSNFPAEIQAKMMHYKGRVVRVSGVRDISKQVQAEQALRESEDKYRHIVENAIEGIFQSTLDGRFLMVNPTFAKIYGYESPEELLAEVTDIREQLYVDKNDRDRLLGTVKGSEMLGGFSEQNYRKDGSLIWTVTKARAVRDEAGQILYIEGFVEDVTERVQAEQALRKSEKKFRDLFEKSEDALLIIENGKFVDCNQATVKMLRYKDKNDFLNARPSALSPEKQPDGKTSFEKETEMMSISIEKGSHRFIWEHQRADGEVFPVEVLLTVITVNDEQQVLHTTWRDITERVQAEEALRESEAHYRLLAENITDIIWTMDMNLRLTYMSPSVMRMSGYSVEEIMALSWNEMLTPDSSEKALKIFQEELLSEQTRSKEEFWSRTMELEQPHKDGHIIWTEVTTSFLRDPDGKPVGVLGVTRDISERVQAEKALKENEERLRTLINATPDIICFKDELGRWLAANDATLRLFQLEDVDYIGKIDRELSEYSDFYREAFLACEETDEIAWQAGDLSRSDEIIPTPDQGNKVYDVIKVPLFNEDGSRKALVVLGRDITDFALAQNELDQHIQQIRGANRITSALSASLDLEELLEIILEESALVIRFDSAAIFFAEDNSRVTIVKAVGDAAKFTGTSVLLNETFMQGIGTSRQALILDNARKSPYYTGWDGEPLILGWMGIPLYARDSLVGYLTFDSREPRAYTRQHAALAQSFAPQIAQALYNARLHKELQQHLQELETLNTVTAALSRSLALDEVLKLILEQIKTAIPFDSASIFLIEEETLKVAIAEGLASELVGQTYPLENELMKTLFQTKESLILSDAQTDDRFENWDNTQAIRSWMGVPLIARDEVIGFLTLDSYQADIYTPEHAAISQPLARQAAQAIHNASLYEHMIADTNEMEKRVQRRTEELQNFVNLTAGREIRMAELKKVIKKLRKQIEKAGMTPIANDPLSASLL